MTNVSPLPTTAVSTTRRQRTLADAVVLTGVGLFTNAEVRVRIHPADPHTGLIFRRTDGVTPVTIPTHIDQLVDTPRRTSLGVGGRELQMVEHTLAALTGLDIDNAIIEVDGPELPGLDGSSFPTVEAILQVGLVEQDAVTEPLFIEHPVEVADGRGGVIRGYPATRPLRGDRHGLELTYRLDHPHPAIGHQTAVCTITPEAFAVEIAPARTFVAQSEVAALRAAGYGQRLTERDLCVFGDDPTHDDSSPKGGLIDNELRFANEPARHKLLDCLGDFALAGRPIIGHIVANRGGHALNHAFVRELLRTHVTSLEDAA